MSGRSNTNGVNVSYTYDSLNRLHTVVDHRLSGSQTTTYTYDGANNVYTVAYPNGVTTTYSYDSLNRVNGLGFSNQSGVYAYLEDSAGKKTSGSEPSGRSMSWNYDGINRLQGETIASAASGKNGGVSYTLDPVGNRTAVSGGITGLSPVSGSYNADDHLSAESYSDNNGNVTTSGGKNYAYNSQNQLISMTGTATLAYDGDGNRVSKTVGTNVTHYLVDDLNPTGYPQVVDELLNGSVTRSYAYGLQRISEYQYDTSASAWKPSFYLYDGFGSVRQLTNTSGTITDTYEYDAFGNLLTPMGPTPNEMLYRGEQYDSDLGLYYLRARYYNPLTGRFMSRDPEGGTLADPKSLHKYLYANGDPVNGWDPRGRQDESAGYAITIARFLIEAPKLAVWSAEAALCLIALGDKVASYAGGEEPKLFDVVVIGAPCGIFFSHSGALLFSMIP